MADCSSDEGEECPLCVEPLVLDDLQFFPCSCGYQICRFCWHRIRTEENGLCPACRQPYQDKPAEFNPVSQDEYLKVKEQKRQKKQEARQKIIESRKQLQSVRVVQKNLVYVIGLPPRIADEATLRKPDYFGKYGKILKIVVNRQAYAQQGPPTFSAYVTFVSKESASACVRGVNESIVDDREIKASLGTTKYCSSFLRGQPCTNTDCMYLHELGDQAVSYTKEDMIAGRHTADVNVNARRAAEAAAMEAQAGPSLGAAAPAPWMQTPPATHTAPTAPAIDATSADAFPSIETIRQQPPQQHVSRQTSLPSQSQIKQMQQQQSQQQQQQMQLDMQSIQMQQQHQQQYAHQQAQLRRQAQVRADEARAKAEAATTQTTQQPRPNSSATTPTPPGGVLNGHTASFEALPQLGALFQPVAARLQPEVLFQSNPTPTVTPPPTGLAHLPWASNASSIFDGPEAATMSDWQQELQSLFPSQHAMTEQPAQGKLQASRPGNVAPTPPKNATESPASAARSSKSFAVEARQQWNAQNSERGSGLIDPAVLGDAPYTNGHRSAQLPPGLAGQPGQQHKQLAQSRLSHLFQSASQSHNRLQTRSSPTPLPPGLAPAPHPNLPPTSNAPSRTTPPPGLSRTSATTANPAHAQQTARGTYSTDRRSEGASARSSTTSTPSIATSRRTSPVPLASNVPVLRETSRRTTRVSVNKPDKAPTKSAAVKPLPPPAVEDMVEVAPSSINTYINPSIDTPAEKVISAAEAKRLKKLARKEARAQKQREAEAKALLEAAEPSLPAKTTKLRGKKRRGKQAETSRSGASTPNEATSEATDSRRDSVEPPHLTTELISSTLAHTETVSDPDVGQELEDSNTPKDIGDNEPTSGRTKANNQKVLESTQPHVGVKATRGRSNTGNHKVTISEGLAAAVNDAEPPQPTFVPHKASDLGNDNALAITLQRDASIPTSPTQPTEHIHESENVDAFHSAGVSPPPENVAMHRESLFPVAPLADAVSFSTSNMAMPRTAVAGLGAEDLAPMALYTAPALGAQSHVDSNASLIKAYELRQRPPTNEIPELEQAIILVKADLNDIESEIFSPPNLNDA
eukprot:TRINITY_DN12386_c0_g2_i4.p1 TRINITY_DN12386_c0_g2~~TRINITY_DN12386_c0_g2_i4.p1  ORF type:complete len:1089 (+),score=194.73 TRINITY_DN12386_c0_g2_i4:47-3313(+)